MIRRVLILILGLGLSLVRGWLRSRTDQSGRSSPEHDAASFAIEKLAGRMRVHYEKLRSIA